MTLEVLERAIVLAMVAYRTEIGDEIAIIDPDNVEVLVIAPGTFSTTLDERSVAWTVALCEGTSVIVRASGATLALAVEAFARLVRARADAVRAKLATLDEELSR